MTSEVTCKRQKEISHDRSRLGEGVIPSTLFCSTYCFPPPALPCSPLINSLIFRIFILTKTPMLYSQLLVLSSSGAQLGDIIRKLVVSDPVNLYLTPSESSQIWTVMQRKRKR